jgi:hypothetical protein
MKYLLKPEELRQNAIRPTMRRRMIATFSTISTTDISLRSSENLSFMMHSWGYGKASIPARATPDYPESKKDEKNGVFGES